MKSVFIYKTDVSSSLHVQQVSALFKADTSIKQWTFDLEDCDRILRIEAHGHHSQTIEQLLAKAGIAYEQLEYEL
ncbi:hypothetical protein ACFQRK_05035 [Parapedobacter sp. GCM10030251]|uniref:hypothetical protein n=1 Tax=Parapedobacter sp. GCM10030251 TaxID=3273419 RepID=UPI00360D9F6C